MGTAETTQTFQGSDGQTWTLRLTISSFARVKEHVGIDLAQPMPTDEQKSEEDIKTYEDLPLLMRLQLDMLLFGRVLYSLCEPQCRAIEVSEEAFLDTLDGKALGHAKQLFWPLYADFFRQAGQTPIAQMLEIAGKGCDAMFEASQVDPNQILEEIRAQAKSLSEPMSGERSTAPQELSESIPAR